MKIIILSLIFISILPNLCGQPHPFPLTNGITSCLINQDCDPNTVQKVDDPYLFAGECSIAIDRYLSRAAEVNFLNQLIDVDRQIDINGENVNFNPTEYCNLLNSLSDLNIQFFQRAFLGGAQKEHLLYPGENWYKVGQQIVKDINYLYDCKGLPRPVIGGMVYEWMNADNFNNNIFLNHPISSDVIKEYFHNFPEDLNNDNGSYYFQNWPCLIEECVPKTDLKFNKDRIVGDGQPWIENLEFRMYFLHQAMIQINMGYTALHMGLYWDYAKNNYDLLAKMTDAFRNYASDKGQMLILSGETPMQNVDNGLSPYVPDSTPPRFIFDFDSRAMRPREIEAGIAGDGFGCTDPIAPHILNDINNSPCAGNLNAVIDPCTINSFGGNVGGYSAFDPDCYLSNLPYTVHFDGFSPPLSTHQASSGPNSLTYGFNDHNWFAMLPEACKAWWFDYFYCNRRKFHNGNGFLTIPGIIVADWNLENYNDPPELVIGKNNKLLHQSPVFFNEIKSNTLAVKTPTIQITDFCSSMYLTNCDCNGKKSDYINRVKQKCYKINIENKDCSSKYSIHIKTPNGSFLPQEVNNTEYKFCPDRIGTYQIFIRQDNLGLNTSASYNFGTQTISQNLVVTNLSCCEVTNQLCSEIEVRSRKVTTLYPNPVTTYFNIELFDFDLSKTKVLIRNSIGQNIIISGIFINSDDNVTVDVENLTSGLYFVEFNDGHHSFHSKFIKQ